VDFLFGEEFKQGFGMLLKIQERRPSTLTGEGVTLFLN